MSKEEDRFETIHDESRMKIQGSQVIRDRQTGVCYLYHYNGATGGLTVLVNADGSPVVRPVEADPA